MASILPIEISNRREAGRRSALDVHICLVELADNRSAMLLDLSEVGMGVQSVEGPGAGLTSTFRFQLPDCNTIISGEAEIAWADRAGRMGMRFSRISPEMRAAIAKWVASEANPLFSDQPTTEDQADLDARDRVAQLEARIIVSGWAQLQALNFLVDQIAAMTQASGVAIAVEDGTGIVCKASSGIAPQVGIRVDPRSGLSWECVRTREVVQCVDTETDPRVDRMVCRHLNMRSAMLVPVMKDGRVAGLVEVFSSRAHAFNNQTVILLRRVGEAVASLDETAPDISEDALIPRPLELDSAPAPIIEVVTPKPELVPPKPDPVPAAAAEPAIAIVPATVDKPVTPAVAPPAVVDKSVSSVELPVPKVTPQAPEPVAPLPVSAAKPVSAPPVAPPVTAPAPVVEPRVSKPPINEKKEVAAKPTVQPLPKAEPTPVFAVKVVASEVAPTIPESVAHPVLKPPALENKEVAVTPAIQTLPKVEPVRLEPAPSRLPARSAPLPAVAFSGAAAAPAPAFETSKSVIDEVLKKQFADGVDRYDELLNEGRGRVVGIGVAAVIVLVAIVYGGWYISRLKAPSTQPPVQTSSLQTPPATSLPVTVTPIAATTSVSAADASKSDAKPAVTATKPVGTTAQPQSQPLANQANSEPDTPMMIASREVPPPTAMPSAPSMVIAPPNTAGVASILSGPVPAPALGGLKVSQGVTGGKQLLRVQPLYPQAARTMRVTGTVVVRARISRNGTVTQVEVVSGPALLRSAAADAVRRWKYEPFQLNGQPIENDINVQVRFDLPPA